MRVIGTAGHVDHGKSALIAALTGTHPDRLKEEQVREMTIDLGFGWLTLPDGEEIGIVDVPGHRDFIENMLAGVSGIDVVLLVVAVDEGVMPQTREHIAIVDLLEIPAGLIVLTKSDLIMDREWLEAVEADVRAAVNGTVLQAAPVVRVSARTGQGIDTLKSTLAKLLESRVDRPDLGRPRLPIDRVFTMSGFGTVVTGTLSDGSLQTGDEIVVLPSGLSGRIRGIQTHRKNLQRAVPGSRTAVNVTGLSAEQLHRGEVLTHRGQYEATRRLDARLRLLDSASTPLLHHQEVKVFTGTAETTARVRLLGVNQLEPGQEDWIQMELTHPLVCVRGDAFIVRRPSPGETLGGGRIVDPQPSGRHRRLDRRVLDALNALAQGTPDEGLLESAQALGAAPVREITARSHVAADAANSALSRLVGSGQLLMLEPGVPKAEADLLAITLSSWKTLEERAGHLLEAYHSKYPLRAGMPREELKSRLELPARLFGAMLKRMVSEGHVMDTGTTVASPAYEIRFDSQQQAKVDGLMRRFRDDPFAPPSVKECEEFAGEEVLNALVTLGRLVPVSSEVLFVKADYESMVARIRMMLADKGQVTLAEVRDAFHTSRRYAQAMLEHLDAIGMTRRAGDGRVLIS